MSTICRERVTALRPFATAPRPNAAPCTVVQLCGRRQFRQNPSLRRSLLVSAAGSNTLSLFPPLPQAFISSEGRRSFIQSDGQEHLGSALDQDKPRNFPGPTGKKGPPLRVQSVLIHATMEQCMSEGVADWWPWRDCFSDVGMQKILPDTTFIAQWKDRIEGVVITHGHEDHIGAMPWVLPALDPSTPIYSSSFVKHLLQFRLKQYNLWDESRFFTFDMNQPFQLGPFECEALRVTHSIPDCCALIFRSSHGTILHTGDWKIDEDPVDGRIFDRETFEKLSKEHVTLMMSDSTNVLTPGRSLSESTVRQALIDKVSEYNGKGRVVATLFASNLHRVGSLKSAADATGRELCFVGRSLESYLAAAVHSGDAPFHPRELIDSSELEDVDPSKVLVVTTGSQAEPMSALSLASNDASSKLRLSPDDMMLYSAKIIPGNEKRVMRMMNRISKRGLRIEMSRMDNLHASGHGYREELAEVIKLVQPQHFLPVHGESVFLHAHAELARELGIKKTSVIHDGEMLGVKSLRTRKTVSSGSMQLLGQVELKELYNDGNKGTGTYEEMAIHHRLRLSINGIIVVSVDVMRPPRVVEYARSGKTEESSEILRARVKLTVRGLWTNKGKIVRQLFKVAQDTIEKCPIDSSCVTIERSVSLALRRSCRNYNQTVPEVIVVVHEHDPRIAAALAATSKTEDSEDERPMGRSTGRESVLLDAQSRRDASRSRGKRMSERRKPPQQIPLPSSDEESDEYVEEASMEDLLAGSPNGTLEDAVETASTASGDAEIIKGKSKTSSGVEESEVKSEKKKPGRKKSTTGSPTTKKRQGRPPKKKPENSTSPGELVPIPEGLLEERRQRNPREHPVPGADVEYG